MGAGVRVKAPQQYKPIGPGIQSEIEHFKRTKAHLHAHIRERYNRSPHKQAVTVNGKLYGKVPPQPNAPHYHRQLVIDVVSGQLFELKANSVVPLQ